MEFRRVHRGEVHGAEAAVRFNFLFHTWGKKLDQFFSPFG